MANKSNAFATFSIGTTKAASIVTEFSSDTFKVVNYPREFGTLEQKNTTIEFDDITAGFKRRIKGGIELPSFEVTFTHESSDAGQAAMRAAALTTSEYNFKLELSDKPDTGASPKNTVIYFRAFVNAKTKIGNLSDVPEVTYTLELTQPLVRVDASAT